MDAAGKEDVALKCGAGWACADAAPLNFAACPSGWTASAGGVCTAPSSYDGICGHATNFSGFSTAQKAKWSAMCAAQFPSAGGVGVGAYVEQTQMKPTEFVQMSFLSQMPLDLPKELVMDVNKAPFPVINVLAEPASYSASVQAMKNSNAVLAASLK